MRKVLLAALLLFPSAALAQRNGSSSAPGVQLGGAVDTNTLTGRSLASHESDCINPKDAPYGALGNDSNDDSAAFAAAINAVNALRSAGSHVNLCVPAGYYRIVSTPLPSFLWGGMVIGTYHQTMIKVDPSYSGDVFSWSEAWVYGASYSPANFPLTAATERAAPGAINVTVTGSVSSPNLQNAFMFYDRDDHVLLQDVEVFGMHGRCFGAGLTKAQALAFMRESTLINTYFSDCGAITGSVAPTGNTTAASTTIASVSSTTGVAAGMTVTGQGIPDGDEVASVGSGTITLTEAATASATGVTLSIWTDTPAVEINAVGAGDSTNQINWYSLNVFEPAGRGVVIRSQNATKKSGQLRFYGLRVESGAGGQGDQLQVGDTGAAYTGGVSDTIVYGAVFNTSVAGFSSIGTYANSSAQQPYGLTFQGQIPIGAGIGLNDQAGRNIKFQMQDMGTTGTQIVVGPSTLVGSLYIDGDGAESGWTNSIDATSTQFVHMPAYTTLGNIVSGRSAGAFGEGNSPGAWGFTSGFSNRDMGSYSAGMGLSTDGRLLYAATCQGSAALAAGARGGVQNCIQVLGGTTTATTGKLTADALTPNATDELNLTPGTGTSAMSETCRGDITARDQTNGNTYAWGTVFGAKRPGAVSTTTITFQTVTPLGGDSALSGITPTIAADTTNGGITVQVAATSITDTVHYSLNASCGQVE